MIDYNRAGAATPTLGGTVTMGPVTVGGTGGYSFGMKRPVGEARDHVTGEGVGDGDPLLESPAPQHRSLQREALAQYAAHIDGGLRTGNGADQHDASARRRCLHVDGDVRPAHEVEDHVHAASAAPFPGGVNDGVW